MTIYKYFKHNNVELQYSIWHFLSGEQKWFCRIWEGYYFYRKEAYGKTKFEAYRNALKSNLIR